MHIDGERNTAEANERYTKFFFAQDLGPAALAIRAPVGIMRQTAARKHLVPSFHHGCGIDPHRLEYVGLLRLASLLCKSTIARFHHDVLSRRPCRHVEG